MNIFLLFAFYNIVMEPSCFALEPPKFWYGPARGRPWGLECMREGGIERFVWMERNEWIEMTGMSG